MSFSEFRKCHAGTGPAWYDFAVYSGSGMSARNTHSTTSQPAARQNANGYGASDEYTASADKPLIKAYELAYFITGTKVAAKDVATQAMLKLEVAAAAQHKRLYYNPTGHSRLRTSRTKVSLGELHLLQRLIYIESDGYERQKEQRGELTDDGLLIHFLKHLVRITLKRNSFYVTLGLSRLLHNYSTAQAMEIYNVVVQDPDLVRDDYYYRSRKKRLLEEMKERFGEMLTITRVQRGEERFETQTCLPRHLELIAECLTRFTPWETPCVVPNNFNPTEDTISPLTFNDKDPDEEHKVEINRIHATLDPECFKRLARALEFDVPEQRLSVPRFSLSSNRDDELRPRGDRRQPPKLSEQEMVAISDALAEESTRRRAVSGGLLRIIVDGVESARIDLNREKSTRFEVKEGAELIEVRSRDKRGELLLATRLLDYNAPGKSSIVLEGGQELSFSLSPFDSFAGEVGGANVEVTYRETKLAAVSVHILRQLKSSFAARASILKPALAFGLIALSIAAAIYYFQARARAPQQTIAREDLPSVTQPGGDSAATSQPNGGDVVQSAAGGSDDKSSVNRKEGTKPQRPAEFAARPTKEPDAAPGQDENAVAESEATRTLNGGSFGLRLAQVKRVFVEALGDQPISEQVRGLLIKRLAESRRLTVAQNMDEADAVLKLSAMQESNRTRAVIVRLVNADGYVIWPVKGLGSGQRYTGRPVSVAARILEDLVGAVRRVESKKK